MNIRTLLIVLLIFEISVISFFLLIKNLNVDIEIVRAFAMWLTMTIGACGLVIAINKFGIDFQSHSSKKLVCVYKERYLNDATIYHVFDLENRGETDIYLNDFKGFDGLIETKDENDDYALEWQEEAKNFRLKNKDNVLSTRIYVIRPNEKITIRLQHGSDKTRKEKLKIYYSVDGFYNKTKYIRTNINFDKEKNAHLFL